MDINLFTLCDYADALGGKEVVVGTFDAIASPQIPFVQSSCAIAVGMRIYAGEPSKHSIHVKILSPDGKAIVPALGGEVNTQIPAGADSIGANFNIKLARIKFESYGRHSVILSIDGQDLRRIPLFILKSDVVSPSEKVVSE